MALKWEPPDREELVRLYLAGESQKALAARYGLHSRTSIHRALIDAGVSIRGRSESTRLSNSKRTPEENRRNTKAAHDAVRGRKASFTERCKTAQTREHQEIGATETERWLAGLLEAESLMTTLQKAVGPYNIDIAINLPPIAVEIFGGNWHGSGRHAARAPKRYRYLLDQGWPFVIIWANMTNAPLLAGAVTDYIVSFAEFLYDNPSARREYRVIWGTGKEITPRPKLNKIAFVPSRRGGTGLRS